jgi:hypothetical protein
MHSTNGKQQHDRDNFIGADADGGSTDTSCLPPIVHTQTFRVRAQSNQWRELCDVTGERVEESDGGGVVALQQEDTIHRVKDAMVPEERGPDADEGTTGEVEEADVPAQLGVARVEVVALGQHHPPPRVEARIDNVTAVQAGGGTRCGSRCSQCGSRCSQSSHRLAPAA